MSIYKNKGFWGGEHGHSHGLQELIYVIAAVCLSGWLVSPVLGLITGVYMWFFMNKYWVNREIDQSMAMVRKEKRTPPTLKDLEGVPKYPTKFWTKDAIEDVKFPEKIRPIAHGISYFILFQIYKIIGLTGLLIDYLIR